MAPARLIVALAFLMTALVTVHAQVPPQSERGFKPDQLYHLHGIDSVNVYNGNVNMTIPLASYPVAADVSYSFDLRYSGKVWTSRRECPIGGPVDPDPPLCKILWLLSHTDNAGTGWRLAFGELGTWLGDPTGDPFGTPEDLFQYRAPDGAEHLFYKTLHDPPCPSASDCDPINAGVFYTRDGTLLRLKMAGSVPIVEFPDGRRHRYQPLEPSGYRLEYIYGATSELDAQGKPLTNWVKFEWLSAECKITDSHGREHVVRFESEGDHAGLIDYVRVAAVETPDPNDPAFAEYNFVYDNAATSNDGTPPTIALPCDYYGAEQETTSVRFLRRIDTPAGEKWEFQYSQPPAGSPGCNYASGTMTRAILPTGGRINWTYHGNSANYESFVAGPKVHARCLRRDDELCSTGLTNANQQDEYTTYAYDETLIGNITVDLYGRKTAGQWAPDSRTVYRYAGEGQFLGLPIAPTVTDNEGRFLSSETFDCNAESGTCGNDPERRRYVKYEMDYVSNCEFGFPCSRDRDRRVVSERTQYLSDGVASGTVDTDRSQYDGLGHYRYLGTEDNLGDGGSRVTYVGYNDNTRGLTPENCGGSSGVLCTGSSVGTYALTLSGNRETGFTMLDPDDSWILGTHTTSFRRIDLRDGTLSTAHAEACFDPRTGFLQRTRAKRRADGIADPADLLAVYTRDSASGYPSREEWFGGDRDNGIGNLVTTALCSMSLPSHDAYTYRRDHTYQYGALATSRYMDGASPLSFYSVENSVIDQNTGLVREAKDVSGLATSFEYDRAGRLTKVSPPGAAATTYTYTAATATATAAAVEAETSSGTTVLLKSRYEFDPYGRVARTKTLQPADAGVTKWSIVDVNYDHAGRRKKVSEPYFEGDTTQVFTSYEYDLFGRTTRVTAPDNSATTWSYGARHATRTSTVQLVDGPTAVDVTELYDGFGRLVEVQEPAGPEGATVFTTYRYDVGGRLTRVEMKGAETDSPVQVREFDYDLLGLLRKERHPESDRIFHSRYDARGHARLRLFSDPALATRIPTPHDQRYTFDKAERLTLVEVQRPDNTTTPSFFNLKQFTYGAANDVQQGQTNYTKGKLLSAGRWNYSPDPQYPEDEVFRVTETYAYADAGGRKTDRATLIELSEHGYEYSTVRLIEQHVVNNELGLPSRIDYPECAYCTYSATKSINATYAAGRLSILGRTDDDNDARDVAVVSYWPNGMTKTVLHGNSMVDDVELADGMARPKRIRFETWTQCIRPSWVTVAATPASTVSAGQLVTLTATVGPSATTTPLEYVWWKWEAEGYWTEIATTAGPSITVTPVATTSYKVVVSNECQSTWSSDVVTDVNAVADAAFTVTVSTCEPPEIVVQPEGHTAQPGAAVRLEVTATGTAPLGYAWYAVGNPNTPLGSNEPELHIPAISQTTRYACRVTNACGEAVTQQALIAVAPSAPTGLTATLTSPQTIDLAWSPAARADYYVVERMAAGGSFGSIGTASGTTYTDSTGLAAGTTYVYRVFAVDSAGGSTSATSNRDLATTMTFTNIVAGATAVNDSHFAELLIALNAMQAANGWPALTWAAILPAGVSAPTPETPVTAAHLEALREKMSIARQGLGVGAGAFADDPIRSGETVIRAAHITALQHRAQ